MPSKLNRIIQGDCLKALAKIEARSVDLVFADPPFNIGYDYDEYDDSRSCDDYLGWSKQWMTQVVRLLKPSGTFWLAIGDDYAAEMKVLATRELGLTCRNWVVWYYTFGVHCKHKFTRSHTHMFYFVRDPENFTFNDMTVRVPSARQLVYGDKRANPKGRLPDDTWIMLPTPNKSWILRPQDLPQGFQADNDTWYFPRVCGTFKERSGFHGCQMPEQLLGRIIRASSNEGDLVLDPFAGSATTLAVAKKLGRRYLGIEVSKGYVAAGRKRLRQATHGDPLDGAADPVTSAPNTANGVIRTKDGKRIRLKGADSAPEASGRGASIHRHSHPDLESKSRQRMSGPAKGLDEQDRAIITAFEHVHAGYSIDRLLADKSMNQAFIEMCEQLTIPGAPTDWNVRLLGLRKARRLAHLPPTKRLLLDGSKVQACEFGSEIAWRSMADRYETTLDGLLCNPEWASEFDKLAAGLAPDIDPVYYRWAALGLRKQAKAARVKALELEEIFSKQRLSGGRPLQETDVARIPNAPGVYLLRERNGKGRKLRYLYVGETPNLQLWAESRKKTFSRRLPSGLKLGQALLSHTTLQDDQVIVRRALKSHYVTHRAPCLNHPDFATAAA